MVKLQDPESADELDFLSAPIQKRKRSNDGSQDEQHSAKNLKRLKREAEKEDMKPIIKIRLRNLNLESTRRRWYIHHHHLFTPLLPKSGVAHNVFKSMECAEAKSNTSKKFDEIIPFKELEAQPDLIAGGVMKDYQLHGLSFLVWMYRNGINCILADEMGLGKTLQTLSLFAYIKEHAPGAHLEPHLVVCPLSVYPNWLAEIQRWLPSFTAVGFHSQQAERDRIKLSLRPTQHAKSNKNQIDIIVTTYEIIVSENAWFKSRKWGYVVLDEGHKIKNHETNVYRCAKNIGGPDGMKLILTGTPVQNNLSELWSLLAYLYPSVFTPATQQVFNDAYNFAKGSYDFSFLNSVHKLLNTIMLRRTKSSVLGHEEIPPKEETTIFIPMTGLQRFWTYRLLMRMDDSELKKIFLSEDESNGGVTEQEREYIKKKVAPGSKTEFQRLMNLLMELRKICDHPYMLKDVEPTPYVTGEHLIQASSKLIFLDKLLKDVFAKEEQVLIFSQWTTMMDLLEEFMELRGYPFARLDGSTNRARRSLLIKLFQREESPYKVFLISTKAGNLGITLTKASTVVMFDSDWNPQNDLQAIGRAHRIGQTNVVKVYRLICQGSVEDQMLDRIRRKLFLSLKVMGNPSNSSNSSDAKSNLGTSELMDILRKGSSALSSDSVGLDINTFLKSSFEEIFKISKEREDGRQALVRKELSGSSSLKMEEDEDVKIVEDAEEEQKRLLQGVAQVQSRLFEGRVIPAPNENSSGPPAIGLPKNIGKRRKESNKDVANELMEVAQKRERCDRIAIVDGFEVVIENLPAASSHIPPPPPKRKRATFEHEDFCVHCWDGGELVLCSWCPRVLHPKCQDLTTAQVTKMTTVSCPQHHCAICERSNADAGGMLFRCQTCPDAFCEDCIDLDKCEIIGETIPEFLLCDYGQNASAYFIRCDGCLEHFKKYPKAWREREKWMKKTERELEAKMRALELSN
ncbi:SNF2 family N-terminal domain-containing protein [Abortiporus biennis]|nr:SNF2 family N-terminal domain-containing protein [Abortiporus biennis]